MTVIGRLALCRLVLLRCGLLRRPAAVSPALLLLLRSGLAVRLCGTSGQCGLDLSADACGSLIAERIRAARRVGVYARLVLLEAGVRVVPAASATRIISVVSVVSALAGARRGCLRLLLSLLLGGLLAAGRTLGIRSRLTRLLLGFLLTGNICGDLFGGGVLGDRLAAAALVRRSCADRTRASPPPFPRAESHRQPECAYRSVFRYP